MSAVVSAEIRSASVASDAVPFVHRIYAGCYHTRPMLWVRTTSLLPTYPQPCNLFELKTRAQMRCSIQKRYPCPRTFLLPISPTVHEHAYANASDLAHGA